MAEQSTNIDQARDPTAQRSLLLAEAALNEVIRRRQAGEPADDESVLAEHPDVRDLLAERLSKLKTVERALSDRLRSGLTSATAGQRNPRAVNFPKISDRYELLREINHGGQAVIFLARDTATERNVAIKVLRSGTLADERERQRFEREADILSQLHHPGIVTILDRGRTPDGLLYLVMNYIPGEPLAAETMIGRPLSERLALFVTICRIVQAAHDRKIVHRDLKPSNIRIDDRGVAHVLDFGLAVSQQSLLASMTVSGQFLGTFLWASPEQAVGTGEITSASDVYSLGVILYQLASAGAFPPQVFAVVSEAIESAAGGGSSARDRPSRGKVQRRVNSPAIPQSLLDVIDRALDHDPSRRFANAAELANAVESFLASPTSTPTSDRGVRKLASLGAVGVILAIAIIALVVIARRGTSRDKHAAGERDTRMHYVNGRPTLVILGRELHWIPPGHAELGAPLSAPWWVADERPHRVTFKTGFYMMADEVDQAMYQTVMGALPPSPVVTSRGNVAVVNVSWYDAQEFCRRASALTGKRIRLPSEDEWEYAARAGRTEPYPDFIDIKTSNWEMVSRYANFNDRSSPLKSHDTRFDDASATLASGVHYLGNRWDLRNIFGNAWEWTAEPYRHELATAAATQRAARSAQSTTAPLFISTRGGSWCDDPMTFRFSNRNPLPPDFKQDNVGFRVVCEDDGSLTGGRPDQLGKR